MFFLSFVRTKDEVDRKQPIKPFPVHWPYLQCYVEVWQRERLLLVPKSRRMTMTWTNIALYTWDTAWNIGRNNAFVSKKAEDSADLVKRALFIMQNLDSAMLPLDLLPPMDPKHGLLRFPETESTIMGCASGADQLRQYTFSGILADELAFWDNAQEMYNASAPTLEGGGRFTGISSAGPGFFKRLVFDKLDQE